MLETGVTLLEALDCIALQADRNPKLKALLEDLSVQVQGGTDFSTAPTLCMSSVDLCSPTWDRPTACRHFRCTTRLRCRDFGWAGVSFSMSTT